MLGCWTDRNMKFFKWAYTTYDKFINIPLSMGIIKKDAESDYHCFKDGDVVRVIAPSDQVHFACLKDETLQLVKKGEVILC